MLSATTTDSQSVTIDYRVDRPPDGSSPLQFNVYRSRDPWFDPGDHMIATWAAQEEGASASATDGAGQPAIQLGLHQLTITVPGGLSLDPREPYVVVVANPGLSSAQPSSQQMASFRTHVIGIVTHGALINPSWKHGPPWELQIATILRQQGYDAVIPFNWVSSSSKPGRAAKQGARLAREVQALASQFPTTEPVDLHFIGHSEGAVVNTQAIVALEHSMPQQFQAGYIEDTLLDPHAANNNIPAQSSTGTGFLGGLARALVADYQGRANDPPVFIPSIVDTSQVFYQHTMAIHDHGLNQGLYNLWGQVPVPNLSEGPISYYNLTAAGAVHSGNYGVALWYRNFVAPTLGSQESLVQQLRLDGMIDQAVTPSMATASAITRWKTQAWGPVRLATTARPSFSGTSAPHASVRVYVGPSGRPWVIGLVGHTTADAQGEWTVTTRQFPYGRYRAVAMAYVPALRTRPALAIVAVDPLGSFMIPAHRS
jgi:hypothetical protein